MLRPRFSPSASSRRIDYDFRDDVRSAAQDRWHFVLQRCGVPAAALTGEKLTCPSCGSNGFRYLDTGGRGSFVCRKAGRPDATGGGFAAMRHLFALNFGQAVRMAAEAVGLSDRELPARIVAAKRSARRAS